MPWPDCAPCHSLPDGGGGNRPPSGQPNVPANSRQSGLRVPLAASSPRYLALTNIRRRSQSLPAATEDRHRPPSTPNRARTIALPCPYRPFRCCIVIPSVDLGLGCLLGTFSPSRRQILSTLLWFTPHPRCWSRAVILRYPYLPNSLASSTISSVSNRSWSEETGSYRWVDRG